MEFKDFVWTSIFLALAIRAPAAFEGRGTQKEPYLISSYEDLRALRDDVDSGNAYSGMWFRQEKDIEFPDGENWNPIGSAEDDRAFKGVYDGTGHEIGNVRCEARNAALFENLGGEIRNLGIGGGKFSGERAAAFATFGSGRILNCVNKASVSGKDAAGIASCLSGGCVYFCWNLGDIASIGAESSAAGIASGAPDVKFSYSEKSLVDLGSFAGMVSDSCIVSEDNIQDALRKEYLAFSENDCGLMPEYGEGCWLPVCEGGVLSFSDNGAALATEARIGKIRSDFSLRKSGGSALEGLGTEESPFKVRSREDLELLRDMVAAGALRDGCHFEQTEDIAFPDGFLWKPIGDVHKGSAFKGTYDGKGHCIRNIVCLDQFAGVFALLDGEVRNLSIESGLFYGHTVGSFASHGGAGMKITDCVNKADVRGILRAGGIVDNSSGEIRGCRNLGRVSGTGGGAVLGGISSYGSPTIIDCESNLVPLLAKNIAYNYGISAKRYCFFALFFFFIYCIICRVASKRIKKIFSLRKNRLFFLVFVALTSFSIAILFFGNLHMMYFHGFEFDSFMDLFNSIFENQEVGGNIGIYPPLPILLYKIIARFIPFWNGIDSSLSLRSSIYGGLILLFHILLFVVPFIFIIVVFIGRKILDKILVIVCFLFSGVMLFALERGNIIIYSFLFTFLFLLLYDSKNNNMKNFSYLFLALAASLKLYPAIYGLLLLSKHDFKGSIICFLEFLFLYIACYFLCGFSFATNNFSQLVKFTSTFTHTAQGLNFSMKNFLLLLAEIFGTLTKKDIKINIILSIFSKIFVFLAGIFSYVYSREKWRKIAALSFLCILIPDVSFLYVLLFLFPALAFFLNKTTENRLDSVYSILFASIISIVIIPFQFGNGYYHITGGFVLQMFLVIVFGVLLMSQAIREKAQKKSSRFFIDIVTV